MLFASIIGNLFSVIGMSVVFGCFLVVGLFFGLCFLVLDVADIKDLRDMCWKWVYALIVALSAISVTAFILVLDAIFLCTLQFKELSNPLRWAWQVIARAYGAEKYRESEVKGNIDKFWTNAWNEFYR